MGSTRSPLAAVPGRYRRAESEAGQIFVQPAADPGQHARAYRLENRLDAEQEGDDDQQGHQRLRAAARQHTVVDLEHEQRAGEHQDIDRAGVDADACEGGARAGERGGEGICRRFDDMECATNFLPSAVSRRDDRLD